MSKPSEAVLSKLSKNILDCLDVCESESEFECYQTKYLNNAEREAIERLGGVCEPSGKFFLWHIPKTSPTHNKKEHNDNDVTSPTTYLPPNKLTPNPLNKEIYRDPDDADLDESIKEKGILKPIIVNKNMVILDGHRRWKRANRLGLKEVPVQIRGFEDEALALVLLNRYREKTFSEKMKEADIIEPKIAKDAKERQKLGVSQNSLDLRANWHEGHPQRTDELVSSHVGMKPRTYTRARRLWKIKGKHPNVVTPLLKKVDEGSKGIDGALKEAEKQIAPKKQEEKPFKPTPYTVWNFSKCDEQFGTPDFPGRVPGQIVQNVLHYFSNKGDFVVDPMAGGGTTFDVCKLMNRRCLSFDIKPIRQEIKEHNIRNGFPEEAKNCDLIFLDPPYFKKLQVEERYNHLYIKQRKEFLSFMQQLAQNCFGTLQPDGVVALLISDFIDEEESLLTCEYYNIFKEVGFKPITRIQAPLSRNQYAKYDVTRAIKEKTMLNISRDLYIFRKT